MALRFVPLVLFVVCSGVAAAQPGPAPPPAAPSEHVRLGTTHFERAFYQLTPQQRHVEAAREFDLAVAAFERELAVRPGSLDAHRALGRIHMVRRHFGRSAAHYDALTQLTPSDLDAWVLAALAHAEAGDRSTARDRLLSASQHTDDSGARARLAEYLARLDGVQP